MTVDRSLMIWVAGCVAILAAGGTVIAVRGSALEDAEAKSKVLAARYQKAFTVGDLDEKAALAAESANGVAVLAALEQAEREVIAVPERYLEADVVSASALVQDEMAALRQRSDRTGIAIPASLPFQSGLAQDETQRLLQLAHIHVAKSILNLCLDAQVKRIGTLSPGKGVVDPSGRYALFTAQVELEAPWESVARILEAIERGEGRGLVLTALAIDSGGAELQRVRLTIGQLLRNQPAWKLGSAGKDAKEPAKAVPGRLGRLSGTGGN